MQYFCSIDGLNIVGLGDNSLSVLLEQGLISSWPDLFKLNQPSIINILKNLPGWGDKKVSKIISSIEVARSPLLINFLVALGILSFLFYILHKEFLIWEKTLALSY